MSPPPQLRNNESSLKFCFFISPYIGPITSYLNFVTVYIQLKLYEIPYHFENSCFENALGVSYIDSYSKIDLYTCEVTWTSVVCYLLAFDIFNYYHSVNVVNFTLGSSKEFECYDPELIKQKQSRNHSVNRYPVYSVIFDSLYLHLCFG